jgi:hypothetical protein
MEELSKRERLNRRWKSLTQERSSWMSHWEEISRHLLPQSGRFLSSNRNRGERKHNAIHDSTGTKALRILSAGLMAGMTSPARPWFRLTTSDPQLDESDSVKRWLAGVTRLMLMIFAKSNTYRALHSSYEELGAFGTASGIVLPEFKSVIHVYPLTIGEYAIATDYRGRVNTLYREFELTVGQMVEEFGKEACSLSVQNMYTSGNLDAWVPVIHGIEPRKERDTRKRDGRNMAYSSCYFEAGGDNHKMLRESGFNAFPAICPRWAATGGDIYGTSPAMEALGDIKQLQHEQLRKAQGIDYKTKPPLTAPTSLRNQDVNTLPGGITYVDAASPTGAIRSAFEVNIDLSHLLADIQDVRERIKGNFYADLFLMLANGQNPQMTATEVAERHEEKLLMIGPVLERLHNEILDPMIELTFAQMLQAGIVPEPPQELQGMELNVEFVSMLAQAQRAISTNSIDRLVVNLGSVATIKPEVLDKFDQDKWADAYADMLGVDPELIVPSDKVALIRQQRAEAAQAQQQAELAEQQASTAAKLGSIRTDEPNALADVTRAFSGYTY